MRQTQSVQQSQPGARGKRITLRWIGAGLAGLGLLGAGVAVMADGTTGPIARYEMRAGTSSGMASGMGGGMGGGGGGGRPGMGAMMGMAMGRGGGGGANHELTLELGSSQAPAGGIAKADHFMPAGAQLGVSVPLKTPERVVAQSAPEEPAEREFQRPTGRMLIFWGCGEHAPAGQPLVIDFAKLAAGQMPTGLWSTMAPRERFVSPANSRTYGHWPNDDGRSVSPGSSLLGQHRVTGSYSPEMAFTLTHDFMGALHTSTLAQPSGATLLRWNGLPDATGYHASLIGGKGSGRGRQMGDIVWWSSSATREFGGGLADWLSPATVARLVASRTVLAPQTTTCLIPAEVKQAAPDFQMATLYAYGPEERFVYPPRPANPKAVWNIQWEARIRHRSSTGLLVGMPGMDDADSGYGGQNRPGQQQGQPPANCPPRKKRGGFGGLGGLIGGAMGGTIGGVTQGSGDGC